MAGRRSTAGLDGAGEKGRSPERGHAVDVMLVDHCTMVREGLCALVERQPDLAVVAQAATLGGAGTVEVTPDVIVTDIDLPDARHGDVISGLRRRRGLPLEDRNCR